MTSAAIRALEAERGALLETCAELTDADWKAESGCDGWSVQDVVAHLGALFWIVVDPQALPDASGLPTERAQDVYVEARRSLSPAQILAAPIQIGIHQDALGMVARQTIEIRQVVGMDRRRRR